SRRGRVNAPRRRHGGHAHRVCTAPEELVLAGVRVKVLLPQAGGRRVWRTFVDSLRVGGHHRVRRQKELPRRDVLDVRLRVVIPFEEDRDRKSTRLNSSHVAISYAVFCLKKKN